MVRRVAMCVRAGLYFANFFWLLYLIPGILWKLGAGPRRLYPVIRLAAQNSFRVFGLECEVVGTEKLSAEQNYIYIANHRSWLDQPAMILAAPQLLSFLSTDRYFRMPFLRTTLRLLGCVPVRKGDGVTLVPRMVGLIRQGRSMVIYPEGTRSRDGRFLPFRSGAFVLSARTGVPIVPLYIYGTGESLPRACPFRKVKQVPLRVVVGEPFVAEASDVGPEGIERYQQMFMSEFEGHQLGQEQVVESDEPGAPTQPARRVSSGRAA